MSIKLVALLLCGLATPVIAQTSDEAVAPSRITVKMTPGITSSAQLPTPELIAARKALTQGQTIYTSQMRQLADLGDGFAAYKFAQWLEAQGDNVRASDVAHYYGMAAATGRGGAITHLISILDRMEPADLSRARSDVLEGVVFAYARAGNSHALDAVIRYQISQKPFGRLDTEVQSLVDLAQGEGAATLGLHLAQNIMQDPAHTPADLLRARGYLETATASASLETQLVAANLVPLLDQALAEQPTTTTEVPQ